MSNLPDRSDRPQPIQRELGKTDVDLDFDNFGDSGGGGGTLNSTF